MLKRQTAQIYFLLGLWMGSSATLGQAQVSVLTNHNDSSRTGANLNETTLNISNVNVTQFGKLFSRTVGGNIYAQPLYLSSVNIPGQGVHNVVYVATAQNNVYAFDADNATASTPLWQVNLGPPVPSDDVGDPYDIQPVIGITSTPVIDPSTNTIYCVAKTKENSLYFQRLHALDIATGQEKLGGPVLISATVAGTGDGSVGGSIQFDALRHLNRPGLLLLNGYIYIAFGSHSDIRPYHGWVLAYNATTLQRVAVWNTTPNNEMSAIWQSGQGLVADASGYIYLMTANGAFNANLGGTAYGQSFVKLSTPSLTPLDYFAPYNYADLNSANLDLGTPGPMLLPGTNRLVGGSKEGILYLVDTSNMGHFNAGGDQVLQRLQVASNANPNNPIHGSPVYWAGPAGSLVYVWPDTDYLKAFRYNNGLFDTTPAAVGSIGPSGSFNGPHTVMGAMLSVSANGSSAGTGILWATRSAAGDAVQTTRPGILHAFDAADITRELWNSLQNASRDDFGNFAKYCPPTIANGKVYLATFSNRLVVYGLNGAIPPPDTTPPVVSNGQPTGSLPTGTTQTTLSVSTNENATCRYATTAGIAYASMPNVFTTTGALAHSSLVTGLSNNQTYNYYVRCSDSVGNVNTSDYVISFAVGVTSAPGLVAAYAFNENAGTTTADVSGNSNTGTLSGATWTTQGKYGNALVFNGTSARVTINDSASLRLTTGMTLEAWVKPSTVSSTWRDVIYKGNDNYYLEGTSSNGGLPAGGGTFGGVGAQNYGTATLTVNIWTHLAVTYDGVALRLYVNGSSVSGLARTGNILTSTNPLQIGGDTLYGQYFAGTIDEVRVYNRALTPTEIQIDMNTPVGGTPTDTTPPVISNGQPTGTLPAGTTQTTLSVSTNENATCRYATGAGVAYASMVNVFSTTGALAHSTLVTGLTNGQSYNYYVRCSDGSGNANTGDYVISFSVNTPSSDTTPPLISNGQPTGSLPAGTTQTTLSVSTNENATCRYATTAGIAYASMPNVFSTTGALAHSTLVTGLSNGQSYNYYVRCSDSVGNVNTSDYLIAFAVATTTSIPGLVAAYAFNENAGTTTADVSGNSNIGTLSGATWTTQGKFGNALVFNGTSARVTINDSASLHLTTGMTLEAWVKPSTVSSTWRDVIYKGNDNYFLEGTSSSGGVPAGGGTFGGAGAEVYGTGALAVNVWTHLAATYDGATMRLYVNGVQVASRAQTGNILTSTNPLQIGGDTLYGQYFAGTIDEVRVYNRALSSSELQTDMNSPVPAQ